MIGSETMWSVILQPVVSVSVVRPCYASAETVLQHLKPLPPPVLYIRSDGFFFLALLKIKLDSRRCPVVLLSVHKKMISLYLAKFVVYSIQATNQTRALLK